MATFHRGSVNARVWKHNAKVIDKASSQTSPGKVTWVVEPVDPRGVLIIGKVAGEIRGTRPDRADFLTKT